MRTAISAQPSRARAAVLALVAAAAVGLPTSSAWAGGLYFADRGVRPLGRGGAFVAGADDLGGVWYNAAGVYEAGTEILVDASWLHFTTDYTRQAIVKQTDPNTGATVASFEQTFTPVEGVAPVMPIPTVAGSYKVHPDWVLALSMMSPYSAIVSYPEEVNGEPAPQRYSLITMDGSLLAVVGFTAAWAPSDEWRLGLGIEMLAGRFVTTTMLSTCIPDRFLCAPEQPEWDALTQLDAGPIVAPSGNLGALWIPDPDWRVGASVRLPYWVRAPGEISVRLPSAAVYQEARVEGSEVDVDFELPLRLALGVEWRPPIDGLRVELGGGYEAWSMHDEIRIEPDGIAMRNIAGFPDPYAVSSMTMPRHFRDSFSVRAGGELRFELLDTTWESRLGLSYETGAIPPEYLTPLTVDVDKLTLGMGLGLHLGPWRFDVVYAHIFGFDVEVDPAHARVPPLNPVESRPAPELHTVNAGHYSARANVLGAGLRYHFEE